MLLGDPLSNVLSSHLGMYFVFCSFRILKSKQGCQCPFYKGSPVTEDNHQSFKEAIAFWLHLTSLRIFPGGGGGVFECMCAHASVLWVF